MLIFWAGGREPRTYENLNSVAAIANNHIKVKIRLTYSFVKWGKLDAWSQKYKFNLINLLRPRGMQTINNFHKKTMSHKLILAGLVLEQVELDNMSSSVANILFKYSLITPTNSLFFYDKMCHGICPYSLVLLLII